MTNDDRIARIYEIVEDLRSRVEHLEVTNSAAAVERTVQGEDVRQIKSDIRKVVWIVLTTVIAEFIAVAMWFGTINMSAL